MPAIDTRTEQLLAEHTTVLDAAELADFEAELERFAAAALVERDAQRAEQRSRRVRHRVIGFLLAVVLAVAGLVGFRAYDQHQADLAAEAAAHDRIGAAAVQAQLDEAFYAERAELANADAITAWQAEFDARLTDAVEAIDADLDDAREVLDASKGRVLDDGKTARTDLANAIDNREALLPEGSLLALEAAADSPLDTAAVTEAVDAWEAEQARLEAERLAAEQAAREAEATAQQSAQQQSSGSTSTPTSSSTSTSAGSQQSSTTTSTSTAPTTSGPNATMAAASAAAAKYGVAVAWVGTTSPCGGTGYATADRIYVAGCATGSGTIQLSVGGSTPSEAGWAQAVARNVALHETAHELIARQCGSVRPAVAGARFESVTDAYAAIYLGTGPAAGGYGYTAADAAIAQQIHGGVCS